MNKQYVSESWVWIQNSKGNKSGLVYPGLYSAVGITAMFNFLHRARGNTAIFSLGYGLVFCLNWCMNCLDCYVLLTKRMTKNLLNKAKTVICMGQVVAWRSLLPLGMLFNVVSAFLPENSAEPQALRQVCYATFLVLKARLNLNQMLFYMNHRRT